MFICEAFNKLFNFQKKQLGHEPTLMELYEETHIKKGDKEKKRNFLLIQEQKCSFPSII
jgi:hypothetical protein